MAASVLVLTGATASGKTGIAVRLAEKTGGCIVSADSRQIYRHLDIGTAKPTAEEQQRAPHHLIDIRDPDEYYSAGNYLEDTAAVMEKLDRERTPYMVAGGSGFYISALIFGHIAGQPSDEGVKEELAGRLEEEGADALYAELKAKDPGSAKRIHPNDHYRILRALEINRLTGAPVVPPEKPEDTGRFRLVGIGRDRAALYRRIDARVDAMLAAGLVEEVEGLRKRGYTPEHRGLKTYGYQEVFDFLDGNLDRETMIDRIKQNTRRYAKRQLTWMRKQPIIWIDAEGTSDTRVCEAVERECAFD